MTPRVQISPIFCRLFGHRPGPDRFGTCRRRRCGHQHRPAHDWENLGILEEEGIPAQWARRELRCRRCGHERRVYFGLDPETIIEPCKTTPLTDQTA